MITSETFPTDRLGHRILLAFTFIPIHTITKNGAFIFSSTFPIIAGWLLGFRLGLLFWLLHSLLIMVLAQAVGNGLAELISSGIPSYIMTLILTCGMGKISDLTKILKYEIKERRQIELELLQHKKTLEIQVEERTESLIMINEHLKEEILQKEKANNEKLKLQTSLKRAEKMEAVGILAGSVAHDLNNILSGILSYPDLILLDLPEDSPLKKPLLTIKNSGQRAAAVVQDLLTLVRKEIINSEVTNLNHIISDFCNSPEWKQMEHDYPGVTLKTDVRTDLLNMHGSPVHLSKVIMNLVLNSMEAMKKGGHLIISTANTSIDKPSDTFEVMPEGQYVSIKISDTGDGIAQNNFRSPDLQGFCHDTSS